MVSVVIPAYNEEKIISKCLDAFVKQKTQYAFKVILVDNNSTDKTAEIARSYQNTLDLKIIYEKRKGRGSARNTGFNKAKGGIILSTDADTVVPDNWVETLTNNLIKDKNIVAVTGPCKFTGCSKITRAFVNFIQPNSMRFYRLIFGYFWLSGFNFGIKKSAYSESGGFNPLLNAQEDVELSAKVSKVGKIKFIKDLPVLCSGRRFAKKPIREISTYATTFTGYFFQGKKDVYLSDIR